MIAAGVSLLVLVVALDDSNILGTLKAVFLASIGAAGSMVGRNAVNSRQLLALAVVVHSNVAHLVLRCS